MQGFSLQKILFFIGLALFLPGLASFGYSLYEGPIAWSTDSKTYWGLPICLFVFWIGLAHAGTLLSAIFLALKIQLDRRTAIIAETTTLCCLVIAALFPIMHLGVLENFYMVAPFTDARGNFANVRSPLVWDFCCILVYGLLSLAFFWTHIKSKMYPGLAKLRRPMAWILFPLVLWVHTVVSLDFSTTYVPEWRGAFFPVYFIVGAIFSGLALVNALLCVEGYRVRLLERLMLVSSWMLVIIWLWDFMQKGTFCTSAFIFAGILPQLLIVEHIRDNRLGRGLITIGILLGLWLERLYLVMPSPEIYGQGLNLIDLGLVAFSLGLFLLLFLGIRRKLSDVVSGGGSYFGEVDGNDMAQIETALNATSSTADIYRAPWCSEEFQILKFPLLVGILVSAIFSMWSLSQEVFENAQMAFVNIIPIIYPLIALTAFTLLYLKFFLKHRRIFWGKSQTRILLSLSLILGAFLLGMLYAGGPSKATSQELQFNPISQNEISEGGAILLWNSRCASCHGFDGKFNPKFIREYYPVPQKLDKTRLETLGIDSLTNVVLKGRNNMNAYATRLSETEARALVMYMKALADSIQEGK